MKLLLDVQIPRQLVKAFPRSFEVKTVQSKGWAGTKNGHLLNLAAEHNFTALITADKNLEYQQDLTRLPVMVLVLQAYSNRVGDLEPFVPNVISLLTRESRPGLHTVTLS